MLERRLAAVDVDVVGLTAFIVGLLVADERADAAELMGAVFFRRGALEEETIV
jgi:hypothetical protein